MERLNYSIKPMVDAFNMDDFLNSNKTSKRKLAFLLITGNQTVCGYTFNYGMGSHDGAITNAFRDIYGLKNIDTEGEQCRLADKISENYITAHFTNDPDIGVFLAFYLQRLDRISAEEFELFKQFYDKYNDTIYEYSKVCGHPIVTTVLPELNEPIVDEFGYVGGINTKTSADLRDLLEYLKRIISNYKVLPTDVKIIGETHIKKR